MQVGAGVVAMLPWAASAGWWLLAGIALGAGLAWLRASGGDGSGDGGSGGGEPATPLRRTIRVLARLSRVVLFATVFAVYAAPDAAFPFVAAGFVVVVAVADVLGVRVPDYYRNWFTGLLLVAAAGFIALCVAIAPPDQPEPEGFTVGALLIAALVSTPMFAGLDRRRIAFGALAALAVAAAALYQLGAFRLSLAPDSLREALTAADAQGFQPLLTVVVALATLPAALVAFTGAREDTRALDRNLRGPERPTRASERPTRGAERPTRGAERPTRAGVRERAFDALRNVLGAAVLAAYLGPEGALILAAVLATLEIFATLPKDLVRA